MERERVVGQGLAACVKAGPSPAVFPLGMG